MINGNKNVCPGDRRPRAATDAALLWANGKLNMDDAREAAFASHTAARGEAKNMAKCSAPHVKSHAFYAADYAARSALCSPGTTAYAKSPNGKRNFWMRSFKMRKTPDSPL